MDTEGKRILLVEDEAVIALARRKLLEKHGYRVEHAPNGEAAILAARNRFDLVLMDIELGSGMRGTEAAARIAQDRDIPIVFLSSQASPETFAAVRDIPHYGFMPKGAGEGAFFSTIETALTLSDSHAKLKTDLEKYRQLAERAATMISSRERTAREKDLLLREAHRRMKSGIEVITGVLGIQETELADRAAAVALRDARRRFVALRVLYDKLFSSADYGEVSAREYLEDLVIGLVRSLAMGREIAVETYVEDLDLDVGWLLPLGMIVQELIAMSLEQAFPDGRSGIISLAAYRDAEGTIEIVLGDDGVEPTGDGEAVKGLGPELVDELARHLSATVELRHHGGTTYRIRFSPESKA